MADAITFPPFAAGLTNQKLALLGLGMTAARDGRPMRLPDLVDFVPGVADDAQRILPLDAVLDAETMRAAFAGMGARPGFGEEAEALDPQALFAMAGTALTEARRAGDEAGFLRLCRPLAAMAPAAPIAAAARRIAEWLTARGVATGCQLRIEHDWQAYARDRLEPLFGEGEALYLDHQAILAKIVATFGGDAGPLYTTCNEADLPLPAAAIRDEARGTHGLTLIFRSMVPAELAPPGLGPLAGAALDFAIAAALPRFIGHTRSTFFNALALAAHGADSHAEYWFYNGKAPRLKRRTDHGAFVRPWLAAGG